MGLIGLIGLIGLGWCWRVMGWRVAAEFSFSFGGFAGGEGDGAGEVVVVGGEHP
jgi:hypothetical protein